MYILRKHGSSYPPCANIDSMDNIQMFTVGSLHVSLEIWGAVFCAIAALCVYFSYISSKQEKRFLLGLMVFGGLLLINDALAWYYRGAPGETAAFWVRVANWMTFFLTDIILAVSTAYIHFKVYGKKAFSRSNWLFNMSMIMAALDIIFLILSLYMKWYFYIDENNFYHRSYLSFMTPLCASTVLALNFATLIKGRKNLSHRMFVCLSLCLILPVIASIYQYFHYGASYANIALIISLINLFINVMAEQGETLTDETEHLNNMKMELLISQIGPHFVYNTLGTIKHLCHTDPKQAEEIVDDFSSYLRGNLDSFTSNRLVPFADEVQHIQAYLAIEKIRFGERVNPVYDIQSSDVMIPALTMQPLVENAVSHGLCAREEGGTVTIRSRKEEHEYIVEIIDDGVGFDPHTVKENPEHMHIGIKNVTERIQSMCGGSLKVDSVIGRGTVITITIPRKEGEKTDENSSGR